MVYNDILSALNEVKGADVMAQLYADGVKTGIKTNAEWYNYYKTIADDTGIITEWVSKSGKPVGIYSVESTESVATSLLDSTATELISTNSAFGTEIGTYGTDTVVKLSTVGETGATSVGDFIVGEMLPAVASAGVGVLLGVSFDKVLYESNRDYWDEKLPTLNPETWDDIILGHDTKIPFLHNTRTGTSYVSEDAVAYVGMVGENEGWFADGTYEESTSDINEEIAKYNAVIVGTNPPLKTTDNHQIFTTIDRGFFVPDATGNLLVVSDSNAPIQAHTRIPDTGYYADWFLYPNSTYTMDGKTVYYTYSGYSIPENYNGVQSTYTGENYNQAILVWVAMYGHRRTVGGVDGVNKIGVTPNLTGLINIDSVKNKLRESYQNLYDNAVNVPQYDPTTDSVVNKSWLPINLPNNFVDDKGDITNKPNNKPTTDNLQQTDDGSYPDENIKNNTLNDTVTPTVTINPPINPNPINPIIGSPSTPPIITTPVDANTGLGAVYVPTIGELKSFSSWLWSDNFIEQIKKLFSDPMQGIVGLHQIYFTPSHDGTDTIHCGYLDSGVSSDYTNTRYYNIDCGTINVNETYGNIFDYDPLTTIEMYLPFIGIVPLKVGDIMRSKLNVTYVCDVLTGACLCNINVIRDGATCCLYTYGGNCAVNYPLSSGSYMGIVSALAGVGLSIGTAVATGGASIPLTIGGGALSMMNAHTNVKTSGGYGGNTGAMGIKKPYLIIKNTLSSMPNQYEHFTGNPYNNINTLINSKGFTQATIIHINNTGITQNELNEISTLFSNGVIL